MSDRDRWIFCVVVVLLAAFFSGLLMENQIQNNCTEYGKTELFGDVYECKIIEMEAE